VKTLGVVNQGEVVSLKVTGELLSVFGGTPTEGTGCVVIKK
jgi:hypothetical protein